MVELMLRQEQLRQLKSEGSISRAETIELIGIDRILSADENSDEVHVKGMIQGLDQLLDMECTRLTYGEN
jgi:hypothetical protein